jgi:nitric oxide reductase subunit B
MSAAPDSSPLSSWWRNAAVLVMVVGFAILSLMTYNTYRHAPPIPAKVVDEAGDVLFTRGEILGGQEVFLKYGLMEHGTLWGHGAYLGPDYGTNYLHREAEISREVLATGRYGKPFPALDPAERDAVADSVRASLKTNRYDAGTSTLLFTPGEAASWRTQKKEWGAYFTEKNGAPGLPARYIKDPGETDRLTSFFAWASWASRANRPGKDYSYTNNFPYEPLAGNGPTSSMYLWSALSLVFLLGALGLVLFLFGKFDFLGWKGHPAERRPSPLFEDRGLTPSQWATGLYLVVAALLLFLQVLTGGAMAHYRVEPGAFYGIDIAEILPYNLLRTWHLQLGVFWIATAWVAGGLFLAPLVGGAEPKGQRAGVLALLGALAVVVFGSLFGEYLGINDRLGKLWFWFGHQGSEYLDLGRFWQVLLAAGLVFWLFLMFRALRPAIRDGEKGTLSSLFLYAAVAIPLFYLPAFFFGKHTNFAVIDNWRFWIIHLWVEGFFELFATVLVAVMFASMGLVTAKTATRVVYLDAILYLGAGIVGTAHHWYFTGQTTMAMALGACFSAMEVVPLTLLTLDAWDFIRLGRAAEHDGGALEAARRQKWAIYFLMAVGVWNFVGAGVFGFLINLPIVSYFEIGTLLTPNHGHAAMFGVFGMLALAVLVFALRAMQSDEAWAGTERYVKTGFWGLNVGLALMLVLNLFPAGVIQLLDVVKNGYWHARQVEFLMTGTFHTLEWLRIVGDLTVILLGVVPLLLAVFRSMAKRDLTPSR